MGIYKNSWAFSNIPVELLENIFAENNTFEKPLENELVPYYMAILASRVDNCITQALCIRNSL